MLMPSTSAMGRRNPIEGSATPCSHARTAFALAWIALAKVACE
jgi:hypothetical protein